MISQLLILGGFIFVSMGLVHGLVTVVDVLRPTQFTPADDSVRVAMKSTTVRFLKARANVWDAWLGFNLSHSLGMFLFGSAVVGVGLYAQPDEIARAALVIPTAIGLIYIVLSVRFWFWAPVVASSLATTCFAAALWLR